jgi:TrpR family transcriptional regulator, trp operon repressor
MNKKEFDDLIDALLDIKTRKGMIDFVEGLLTDQELEEIPQRLAIVKMLKSGVPHHEIARKLRVGVATVTRGSKELQKGRFTNV